MPVTKDLHRLFDEAKTKNEFEFVCTLINYKDAGSRLYSPNVFEWVEAIKLYERWYREPRHSLHEKARFALMIYATFFELTDLYIVLGNLSRIIIGYRTTPYLYWKHEKANRWLGASERISLIQEILIDSGFEELKQFFSNNHYEQVRHAFFHSTYAFNDDEYILHDVEPLYIDYVGHPSLSLTEFIFPKVETILEFFHSFKDLLDFHLKSYQKNKLIPSSATNGRSIEIVGSSEGLAGLRDGEGNAIELKDNAWIIANAGLDFLMHVEGYIGEELDRFSGKDKISSDDGALQHLYEVLSERNIQSERENLGSIYAKLGDILFTKSSNEKNHFKLMTLRKITQKFYDKMTELSPAHKLHVNKSLLKYITASSDSEGIKQSKEALADLLSILKTQIRENVLTNVSVMLTQLKRNGVDIKSEKKMLEGILSDQISPDMIELVDRIKTDISKL